MLSIEKKPVLASSNNHSSLTSILIKLAIFIGTLPFISAIMLGLALLGIVKVKEQILSFATKENLC